VKQDIFASEKAVSSVIGMILIFGITILSISAILLYSVPTMEELQDMAQAQKVEQAFTVFDSRTSKVALGESPIQTTYVSLMGGTITINGDADAYNKSRIVIVSVDIAADEVIDGERGMIIQVTMGLMSSTARSEPSSTAKVTA